MAMINPTQFRDDAGTGSEIIIDASGTMCAIAMRQPDGKVVALALSPIGVRNLARSLISAADNLDCSSAKNCQRNALRAFAGGVHG